LTSGYYDGAGSSRSFYDLGFKGFASATLVANEVAAGISPGCRKIRGFPTNNLAALLPPAVASA